jgi:hypothetical protein
MGKVHERHITLPNSEIIIIFRTEVVSKKVELLSSCGCCMSNLTNLSNRKGGLKEWSRLRVICWYFNWGITILTSVVCMIPLLAYGDKQRQGFPVGNFAALQKFSNGSTLSNVQIKALTDDGVWTVDARQNILISALNMGGNLSLIPFPFLPIHIATNRY